MIVYDFAGLHAEIKHCRWDLSESDVDRRRYILWRANFRTERECLIAIAGGMLADEEIKGGFGPPLQNDTGIDLASPLTARVAY